MEINSYGNENLDLVARATGLGLGIRSTGISINEKPADVLIGIMTMHMNACLMCTCITHV